MTPQCYQDLRATQIWMNPGSENDVKKNTKKEQTDPSSAVFAEKLTDAV